MTVFLLPLQLCILFLFKDGYDRTNPTHHKLMCSVLMTACDLCFNTKSWEISKKVSNLLYLEFFTQGDLEKALGVTPIEMMDKDKAFVPAQQVGFLSGIAGPVYKLVDQFLYSVLLLLGNVKYTS